jgi:hypothetical protein
MSNEKIKLVPQQEDVDGSGDIVPRILNYGTAWK